MVTVPPELQLLDPGAVCLLCPLSAEVSHGKAEAGHLNLTILHKKYSRLAVSACFS